MAQAQTDKLILDITDDEPLAEMVSRMEVGEKRKAEVIISLDDQANKVAVFSVTKATITDEPVTDEDEEPPATDKADAAEEDAEKEPMGPGGSMKEQSAAMEWAATK